YVAYKDYFWLMEFTERLLEKICLDVNNSTEIHLENKVIDFKAPYKRIKMLDVIKENTGIEIDGMDENQLREVCRQLDIEVDETMGKGKLIDKIFSEKCEANLVQPTFIIDYPIEMSPLCKRHRNNPELTERFELIVNGQELANAYSELNDPIDQLERFKEQLRLSEKGDEEAMFIDMDFIRALEYGMPPTSGLGIGMDRLVMLLTGQQAIQEVLLFPQMKPEKVIKSDDKEKFLHLGIKEPWLDVMEKIGIKTIEQLKVFNPNKLHQDLCSWNKKNKLELVNPTIEEVNNWISKAKDN
ncbi:MAG TPA: DUF4332 domain-containing protein, partial [Paludibacteraceae bacterium]|nr:DUF4332 domain-containing protein [Paludibacteraceae bacterium]